MKFLITGGSGFVGSWVLRELLKQDRSVVVYDLKPQPERWQSIIGPAFRNITFEPGNLIDHVRLREVCQTHAITHVIHLGALLTPDCHTDPFLGCQVNVLGSAAVWEAVRAMRDEIQGFAYASSFAALGDPTTVVPSLPAVAAQDEFRTPTFYGMFKRAVELLAGQYWQHYGIASVGIRPFIVYGPERNAGLTAGPSLACAAAVRGEQYTIGYQGVAGYDYIGDVAGILIRAALETPPGAHACDLPSHSASPADFIRLIDMCVPNAATHLTSQGPHLPLHSSCYPCDITTLFSDWQPTPLEEGVRRTVQHYQSKYTSGLNG